MTACARCGEEAATILDQTNQLEITP